MSDMTPEMRELKEAAREAEMGWIGAGPHPVHRLIEAARAVLPQPRRHTFGGVVFEETGEYRKVRRGEWFLTALNGLPALWMDASPTCGEYTILRPVSVEGAK